MPWGLKKGQCVECCNKAFLRERLDIKPYLSVVPGPPLSHWLFLSAPDGYRSCALSMVVAILVDDSNDRASSIVDLE